MDIPTLFYLRLVEENLPKEATYLIFVNKNWERFEQIRDEFLREHNLSLYNDYHLLQKGALRWLGE